MKSLATFFILCVAGYGIYFLSQQIADGQKEEKNSPGCLMAFLYGVILTPLLAFLALAAIVTDIVLFAESPVLGVLGIVLVVAAILFFKKSLQKHKAKMENKPEDVENKSSQNPFEDLPEVEPVVPARPTAQKAEIGQGYIAELDAYQAIRKIQNAHYKIAVIDFETTGLHPDRDEILQVSIIDEEENVLINQLCRPEHTQIWEDAWNVNGIYPGTVQSCPTFAQVAPYVQDILSRADMVLAYNYPFEPDFLRNNGIDPDALTWGPDPMQEMVKYYNAAHQAHRERMSLRWAADLIGYQYNPHDAAEDVKATLHVYNFTLDHWAETQAGLKKLEEKDRADKKAEEERKARKGKIQYPENKNADPRHPLYGKTIVITGELPIDRDTASKKAASLGAKVRLQISPKTQIVVCGQREEEWLQRYGEKSYKIKKAEQMNANGANIELMPGKKFMELLNQPAGQS